MIVNDRHLPQWNTRDFRTCKICIFFWVEGSIPKQDNTLKWVLQTNGEQTSRQGFKYPHVALPRKKETEPSLMEKEGSIGKAWRRGGRSQQTSMPQNRPPAPSSSRLASMGLPACYSPSRHLSVPPVIVPIANNESTHVGPS